MPAPRVVLDTSAALMPIVREKSSDAWIREYWEQGHLIPLISDDTAAELMRKVRDPKFGLTEEQAISAAQVYLLYCERVEIRGAPPDTPRCRDPKDQPFIILAYQEQTDFLVTKRCLQNGLTNRPAHRNSAVLLRDPRVDTICQLALRERGFTTEGIMPVLKTYQARIATSPTSSAWTTIKASSKTNAERLLGMMYGSQNVKNVQEAQ